MISTDTPTKKAARRRYPSDLNDEQWRRVAKMIDPHGLTRNDDSEPGNESQNNGSLNDNDESQSSDSEVASAGRGRPRIVSMREVVNAMNYRWRTGCTWRMLPHDFPAWATVYAYFRQWRRDGRLPEIRALLLERETILEKIEAERMAS